ncbi:replication factor A2 [Cryptococcus wingfieldii CBS 7118]|uniref:Replication factor A2 n=1 Tax=Cryptococcus wingfieldii CBS 7118 TaxID=1295528 RepID=A0A1E3JW85_9TREE|nr:replication factor A2 [Cryptococcus wingfieldii CBS 7118]ODO05119.1 replication factor A2 [Cryptococcus wingfieldii CBS 7118]
MSNYDGSNPYYGGAGGGYVAGGGNGDYGSSQDSPGGKKSRGNATIRPLTIKQFNEAQQVHPDADFSIDGEDVTQVLLVGSVRNASTTATNVAYEIGDGTGYVDVKLWLDSADDQSGKTDGIQQDSYIGVMGTIKSYNNKRHVSATHVRPITDPNEIQHHLLKALHVSLLLRGGTSGNAGANRATTDYRAPTASSSDYAKPAAAANHGGADPYAELDPLARAIMQILEREGPNHDDGMHVAALSKATGSTDLEQFTLVLDWLAENGHVFTTIDEAHYQIAS